MVYLLQHIQTAIHLCLLSELINILQQCTLLYSKLLHFIFWDHDKTLKHVENAILLEHLYAVTHMGEVGQQSDSVSDRSSHHAALTGCTLNFGENLNIM